MASRLWRGVMSRTAPPASPDAAPACVALPVLLLLTVANRLPAGLGSLSESCKVLCYTWQRTHRSTLLFKLV